MSGGSFRLLGGLLMSLGMMTAVGVPGSAGAETRPELAALRPGEAFVLEEDLTVNVFRIGLSDLIDPVAFAQHLPPANWVARGAEGGGREIEIAYRYHYNIVDAPAWWEDLFFGFLRAASFPQHPLDFTPWFPEVTEPLPITDAQLLYNICNLDPAWSSGCDAHDSAPRVNPRVITQNHFIHGPMLEFVLSLELAFTFGIDVTSPTIVLLNWWGREDYVDHVYLNPEVPVHETGFPRGVTFDTILPGWGGTPDDDPHLCAMFPCLPHRLWFVDLSAGPFIQTGGWDLVSPSRRIWFDEPRHEGLDYRLHHIADYLRTGDLAYRPLDTLTRDLSEYLIGDVFLGTIATAAALYTPALSPPLLPEHVQIDVNRYRWGDPRNLDQMLDWDYAVERLDRLPYTFSVEVNDRDEPPESRFGQAAFNTMTVGGQGRSVYGGRLSPAADLYLYWRDRIGEFLEGDADYEVTLFQFALDRYGPVRFAGYADHNWVTPQLYPNDDGARDRQTSTIIVTTPQERPVSSQSNLALHEIGHHLGLHHPFHGSRCLDEQCSQMRELMAFGDTAYTAQGNYVHGVMSYLDLGDDFSRFERDNLARWVTYQHLRHATDLAAALLARPTHSQVAGHLTMADLHAASAFAAVSVRDYEAAAAEARAAFRTLVDAAAVVNLPIEPPATAADLRTPPDLHQIMRQHLRAMDPLALTTGYRGLYVHPTLPDIGGLDDLMIPFDALATTVLPQGALPQRQP
jgi:hypothetical protein